MTNELRLPQPSFQTPADRLSLTAHKTTTDHNPVWKSRLSILRQDYSCITSIRSSSSFVSWCTQGTSWWYIKSIWVDRTQRGQWPYLDDNASQQLNAANEQVSFLWEEPLVGYNPTTPQTLLLVVCGRLSSYSEPNVFMVNDRYCPLPYLEPMVTSGVVYFRPESHWNGNPKRR